MTLRDPLDSVGVIAFISREDALRYQALPFSVVFVAGTILRNRLRTMSCGVLITPYAPPLHGVTQATQNKGLATKEIRKQKKAN